LRQIAKNSVLMAIHYQWIISINECHCYLEIQVGILNYIQLFNVNQGDIILHHCYMEKK